MSVDPMYGILKGCLKGLISVKCLHPGRGEYPESILGKYVSRMRQWEREDHTIKSFCLCHQSELCFVKEIHFKDVKTFEPCPSMSGCMHGWMYVRLSII